jgi:large-conductance mechanosensitive channel
LFSEKTGDEPKPLIATLWEFFVMAMIAYFVISIINSSVQEYVNEQKEKDNEKSSNKESKKKK